MSPVRRGHAVSEEFTKCQEQAHRCVLSLPTTHPQLGKPWGLLRWLLIGPLCEGGDDALAVAQQVDLQDLGSVEGGRTGQWLTGPRPLQPQASCYGPGGAGWARAEAVLTLTSSSSQRFFTVSMEL